MAQTFLRYGVANELKRMGFKNISQIKYIEREAKFDSKQ